MPTTIRRCQVLKQLADELGIALLLVHHLRKQGDSDPLNKLSGTTGLSGAVDAVFVLDRSHRHSDSATLVCTGRDIAYREMELRFSSEAHRWELVADSLQTPDLLLPPEMSALVEWAGRQALSPVRTVSWRSGSAPTSVRKSPPRSSSR